MSDSDIVADIRNHLQTMAPHQRSRLTAEQLERAVGEIERLRVVIQAYAASSKAASQEIKILREQLQCRS